jgi:hypothetical protein
MSEKGPKFEAMKQIRDEIMELKESPLYREGGEWVFPGDWGRKP